jgi:hypothetical protein
MAVIPYLSSGYCTYNGKWVGAFSSTSTGTREETGEERSRKGRGKALFELWFVFRKAPFLRFCFVVSSF